MFTSLLCNIYLSFMWVTWRQLKIIVFLVCIWFLRKKFPRSLNKGNHHIPWTSFLIVATRKFFNPDKTEVLPVLPLVAAMWRCFFCILNDVAQNKIHKYLASTSFHVHNFVWFEFVDTLSSWFIYYILNCINIYLTFNQ